VNYAIGVVTAAHRSECHVAKILHDHIHTYKCAVVRHISNLEPEVEFRRQGTLFRVYFGGIFPPPIKISLPNLVCR